MKSLLSSYVVALLLRTQVIPGVYGIPNCPYAGAVFPKPTALASSERIKAALANLTEAFEARSMDASANPNGTSWSIQVFSASDPDEDSPLWSHYHTATDLLSANTPGVKSVSGDTVYRLGSVTKIFTILTFLAEAGDVYLNTPVTQWVPELELLSGKAKYDPIMNVDWDSITLQDLASHMAGIVRDYAIEGELTQEQNQTVLSSQGFPPPPREQTPICGEAIPCSRAEFFTGLANIPPSFQPSLTAGYSNMGYQILSYALETLTQKRFADMLQADIIDKLGLQHTFYQKPDDSLGVIPQAKEDMWAHSLGEASPTGNMYSSANDLSRLGRAIFRSTLIPAAQTRRWLKPAALTADLREGIGSPWGVRRIPIPGGGGGGGGGGNRVVDAYSKAGSINVYMSLVVLLPDYDVGIAALLAGGWPGNANWAIADAIGAALVPALEDAAREQADAEYAGTYEGADGLNSSLVLSTEAGRPGLGVERWVSNGTDMAAVAVRYTLNYNVTAPAIRLYPTGLEAAVEGGGEGTRKAAFKAVVENLDLPDHSGDMFSTNCGTWVGQTAAVYADMPLDQFVFTVGPDGKAVSVEPLALRAALRRAG